MNPEVIKETLNEVERLESEGSIAQALTKAQSLLTSLDGQNREPHLIKMPILSCVLRLSYKNNDVDNGFKILYRMVSDTALLQSADPYYMYHMLQPGLWQMTLAKECELRGQKDEAKKWYRSAIHITDKVEGAHSANVRRYGFAYGEFLIENEEWANAQKIFDLLQSTETPSEETEANRAAICACHAIVLINLDEREKAESMFAVARTHAKSANLPLIYGAVECRWAQYLFYLGKQTEAETTIIHAVELIKAAPSLGDDGTRLQQALRVKDRILAKH